MIPFLKSIKYTEITSNEQYFLGTVCTSAIHPNQRLVSAGDIRKRRGAFGVESFSVQRVYEIRKLRPDEWKVEKRRETDANQFVFNGAPDGTSCWKRSCWCRFCSRFFAPKLFQSGICILVVFSSGNDKKVSKQDECELGIPCYDVNCCTRTKWQCKSKKILA